MRAIVGNKNSELIKYYSAKIAKCSNLSYADLIQMVCDDILKGENPKNIIEDFEKELIYRRSD